MPLLAGCAVYGVVWCNRGVSWLVPRLFVVWRGVLVVLTAAAVARLLGAALPIRTLAVRIHPAMVAKVARSVVGT